ncbi:MAG: hypothetical protein QME12_07110 [Nanoarchaeota archaeon]|nr:hypothetical protein [Nanoarchaeota archaeon]
MKKFHFAPKYFNKMSLDDDSFKLRISIMETPSIEVSEEDYSLRIETRHEDKRLIHREYALEHHSRQEKHNYPHLQFKFHTEEIGSFWIRLDFENSDEYDRAIKGFIYKIKGVLLDLERLRKGIANEIMVIKEVDKLKAEGNFLTEKIAESIGKSQIEFKDSGNTKQTCANLQNNPLLLEFLGKSNVTKIVKSCSMH